MSTSGNVGLFGCSYGTIKNVTIEKSSITSTDGDAYSGAGAIVGYIGNSGSGVTNCHVKSTVTVSGAKVGGIAGSTSNQIVGSSCAANVIGTDYVGGITLADDADNSAILNEFDGSVCDVTLNGHKFYQDTGWNTICLPFDFDVQNDTQIGYITVKELDAENSNLAADGKLTLAFATESTTMKAGKPYIVKWPNGTGDILENPTFTGVTIDKTERPVSFTNNKTSGDCQFVGNYAPLEITDANRDDILLLAAGNKDGLCQDRPHR